MTFDEYREKIGFGKGLTSLQRKLLIDNQVGNYIEQKFTITNIHETIISVEEQYHNDISLKIWFNPKTQTNELLKYSKDDVVIIKCKIKEHENSSIFCWTDLVSISKL